MAELSSFVHGDFLLIRRVSEGTNQFGRILWHCAVRQATMDKDT